ncbi:hypothetical protein MFLO_00115 [Listeria floridensis FSL S10-1187]|uniref:Cardiolipin synthase N-terminal domain-containing protein n=1 Tax=Listeria floridensis FSL S10-1187 TaxID=1265817 RepID=A0ABN0RI50_9LIST|nr:PLD nuclease N-terminal domain-containing protein [Listeria floridensis]EUJ33611.1 hypothetical protein MFLO_00115 [Listeria floridensis FSL S10-1187]
MKIAGIDILLLLPIAALYVILLIVALVDLVRNWHVRKAPVVWLLVILFISTFGPIAYFIFGRKEA